LLASSILADLGLPHPTAAEVLAKTGASRSRAYELRAELRALLTTLMRPPGRPATPPASRVDTSAISRAVVAYLMNHPGAVTGTPTRRRYSDGFRHCVLELAEQHTGLDVGLLAQAVGVPAPTLQDWLATPPPPPAAEPPPAKTETDQDPTAPRIASIVDAWGRWEGGFSPFCLFVRAALAIPYGDTLIGRILATHADRRPSRRAGRSPDEKALRDGRDSRLGSR
jgi:hypothetical protein